MTLICIFLIKILNHFKVQTNVAEEINKIDNWININKLTINYKKSCYMIIGKNTLKMADFKLTINHEFDQSRK